VPTPFHLSGKTILVTGASSGIGRQIAISCSRMGAKLVLSGRDGERLQETLSQLEGEEHLILAADLLKEDERTQLVERLPALDGFAHCAGVLHPFPVGFFDQKKLDETLNANFEAPVLLANALVRRKKFRRDASIVFLSSASAQHPYRGGALYCSSKAALETFAKVLALELYPQGIRCNCLSPAMVHTPMFDKAEKGMSKEEMDKHIANYPLGAGFPEDVANAAVFFLSPASRWITGVNLKLDGGYTLVGK